MGYLKSDALTIGFKIDKQKIQVYLLGEEGN